MSRPARAGSLRQDHTLRSSDDVATLLERLRRVVHVHEGPFVLTFKLSGGGIVSRVMETPKTSLSWFGEVHATGSRLVAIPDGSGITPFQPIVRLSFEERAEETLIRVQLAPHPGQHTWSLPFAGGAVVLGGWGGYLLLSGSGSGLGLAAVLMALAFAVFPSIRAHLSFDRDCKLSLDRLKRDLAPPSET